MSPRGVDIAPAVGTTDGDANLLTFHIPSFGQVWAKGEFNAD